jgi:hypothetical protein
MPKRTRKRMRGGFLESLSSAWQNISQSTSDLYEKSKQSASNMYSSATQPAASTQTSTSSYMPATSSTGSYGGKKRRKMRGGTIRDNIALNNLAAHASPIDGIKSAHPHTWVGGKRTKRRHRKTRRSRRR